MSYTGSDWDTLVKRTPLMRLMLLAISSRPENKKEKEPEGIDFNSLCPITMDNGKGK